jgi:3-oxoacyl-[acyl-carrier protein] reductase
VTNEVQQRHHPKRYTVRRVELGLHGRHALVTGASSGIGLALSRMLVAEGCHVAMVARDRTRLAAAAALIDPGGDRTLTISADLAVADQPQRAVVETIQVFGGLDVLVNNVGVAHARTLDTVSDADWYASFELNLMSYVRTIRAALEPLRRSDQARIVNVASTAGKRPSTGMADYSVMKAAVLSLSRLVADTEAQNGVLSNAICPGPALTAAWLADGGLADQNAQRSGQSREDVLRRVGAGRPLGRLAEPDEIAAVALVLCSAAASYVTGAAWSADGGTVPVIL